MDKVEALSQIANSALMEITNGQFPSLPRLGITGLLNDFQYAWLKRFDISYRFEVIDLARSLCNGQNKEVFNATNSKSINDIRKKFSRYINKWHNDDDRVILSLRFDGEEINAEWIEMEKYIESEDKP